MLTFFYLGGHSLRQHRSEKLNELNPMLQKYLSTKANKKPITNPNAGRKSGSGRPTKFDSKKNEELYHATVSHESNPKDLGI